MTSAASSMIAAKRLTAGFVLVALGVAPSVARADAKADALFREGRTLLDQKKYEEACPKLAESQRLEPGAGTLLALALCHEGQGKTATARKELEEAAALGRKNGRAELAKAAEKRAAAMEPQLSKLVVRMPEASADYEVQLDGERVGRDAIGAPIAVDPGEHKAEVTAKGKAPRTYVVRLSGPGVVEIVVDKLEDAHKPSLAAAPAPASAADRSETKGPPAMANVEAEPPVTESNAGSRGGAQRAIGLTLGGLGIAGLAVGGYFGSRAVSEHNEAGRACASGPCPEAQDANDRSKDAARTAVISATAGFVAVGIGTIVYFTAPKGPSSQAAKNTPVKPSARLVPEAGPTQVGMGIVGTF